MFSVSTGLLLVYIWVNRFKIGPGAVSFTVSGGKGKMQLETVSSPSLYLADYFILILTCGKKKKKKKTGYFEFTLFLFLRITGILLCQMALQIHDGKRYAEPLISLQNRYSSLQKSTLDSKLMQHRT